MGTGATPWYREDDHWDDEHVHIRGWDEADARKRAKKLLVPWFVYVLQSLVPRYGKRGQRLPGVHYVGCTTDVARRAQEHNGLRPGGGKYTAKHRPWRLMAIFGPYYGQSQALKAEYTLKRTKRGAARVSWSKSDSVLCCGEGAFDARVQWVNATYDLAATLAQRVPPQHRG